MKIFRVNNNLFRGSAPDPKDIPILAKSGIQKIVSLDKSSGEEIASSCENEGINHIIIPLSLYNPGQVIEAISPYNLQDLLNGKTFIHCRRGKDRTGFVIALSRTMLDNWDCNKAIREAKELGFGTGTSFLMQEFLSRLIRDLCTNKDCSFPHPEVDENLLDDAVSTSRDTEFMDHAYYGLAPFTGDGEYPRGHIADVETQYPNRADYQISGILEEPVAPESVPQASGYNPASAVSGYSILGGTIC